jgi:hypothetical protein
MHTDKQSLNNVKNDPKVKQLQNIKVQLDRLSTHYAVTSKRRTHADDTAFMLNTAAIMICQTINNIVYNEEGMTNE